MRSPERKLALFVSASYKAANHESIPRAHSLAAGPLVGAFSGGGVMTRPDQVPRRAYPTPRHRGWPNRDASTRRCREKSVTIDYELLPLSAAPSQASARYAPTRHEPIGFRIFVVRAES